MKIRTIFGFTLMVIIITTTFVTPQPAQAQSVGQFPIIPSNLGRASEIFVRGQQRGNRPDVFSKIGDSITATPDFMTQIGDWGYRLGEYGYLDPVINYYMQSQARTHNSFGNVSLAAFSGWTSFAPLDPALANLIQSGVCNPGENPLTCELRVVRPSVALIMIGTNDAINGVNDTDFRNNLNTIIEITINMGVIPVISTLPDSHVSEEVAQRTNRFNGIIVEAAQRYNIPLWNLWLALQNLPDQGIAPDGVHLSRDDITRQTAMFQGEENGHGANMRNLTALQVLDKIWRNVIQPSANAAAAAVAEIGGDVPVESVYTGTTVTSKTLLNVRSQPSTSAPILGSLQPGDTAPVIGEASGWYLISFQGFQGYVHGGYVRVNAPGTVAVTTSDSGTAPAETGGESGGEVAPAAAASSGVLESVPEGTTLTANGSLNFRAQPNTGAQIIGGLLPDGTHFPVLGKINDWYLISADGQQGYVNANFVTIYQP